MKRAVLLSFALFIGAGLSAQNEADFQYTVSNGAVTITGYTGSAKNVTIPERIDGMAVTEIFMGALRDKQLTGVTIPDSVTAIGSFAFVGNQLTNVTIPNSVTVIDRETFMRNQLTSVTIPGSVTQIRSYSFYRNQLTSVTIPDSVIEIRAYAFYDNKLTSVIIPNSTTVIEKGAFWQTPLTSVTMPANVNVEGDPFMGDLADVYILGGKRAGTYRSNDGGETWTRQQ